MVVQNLPEAPRGKDGIEPPLESDSTNGSKEEQKRMVMRSRLSRRSQVRGRVPVFSYDLAEHLQATTSDVPAVVKICTEFVEKYGVTDGIYRLSGVTSNVNKLRLAFEKGTEPNLLAEPFVSDIHCVTSVCKQYFRLLPDPLLTYRLYSQFDEAVRETDIDLRLGRIRNAISQLPPPNYRTLIYLMRHLETMASHSVKTNMHVRNLAIVWAPNLLSFLIKFIQNTQMSFWGYSTYDMSENEAFQQKAPANISWPISPWFT